MTPIQELIDQLQNKYEQLQQSGDLVAAMYVQDAIELAHPMLEKEKEIICNAFSDAQHGAVESRWTAEEYFEEIFNNK